LADNGHYRPQEPRHRLPLRTGPAQGRSGRTLTIQIKREPLFRQIASRPELFLELQETGDNLARAADEQFGGDTQMQRIVQEVEPPEKSEIEKYVHLADIAGATVRREVGGAIEPEMVEVPAGEFHMGAADDDPDAEPDEQPRHRVTFERPFFIGRYTVTFDEYDRFAAATGKPEPDDERWGRGRRPVINVSWDDARAYAEWLSSQTGKSYRLPSEAEWEYACRAGTKTPWAFGDELTEEQANFGQKLKRTSEVGSYPANDWRIHDMHGNVWEWVEDVWHGSYSGDPPEDGTPWIEGGETDSRVVRGGSWVIEPGGCRSTARIWLSSRYRSNLMGFRLARTV